MTQIEAMRLATTKHGGCANYSATPEYNAWKNMRARVLNPTNPSFKHYGGRGITMCERWNEFSVFFADMGPKPFPGATLERKNNSIGYSPDNCKWATRSEQQNNRRTCIRVTHLGMTLTLAQWGKRVGISRSMISYRMKHGMDPVSSIFTPVNPRQK